MAANPVDSAAGHEPHASAITSRQQSAHARREARDFLLGRLKGGLGKAEDILDVVFYGILSKAERKRQGRE